MVHACEAIQEEVVETCQSFIMMQCRVVKSTAQEQKETRPGAGVSSSGQ